MATYRRGTCRVPGCTGPRSMRAHMCRQHLSRKYHHGHPEVFPPSPVDVKDAQRRARSLLNLYGNRKATHEALRLSDTLCNYAPRLQWAVFVRTQNEFASLRQRLEPVEILTRVLTAFLILERPGKPYPDTLSENQLIGRTLMAPLWRRNALGTRIHISGRVVSTVGEHCREYLGPFCLGLIRKAEADAAAMRAAIARSLNFDEVTHDSN